jgi:hypothetical protein
MKKNIYAIIDTETANGLFCPLVYDVSVIIFDKKNNEYFRKNWLISEVWENTELMNSAYYAWKMPLYNEFETNLVNMFQFICEFVNVITEYNVTHLLAYNLPFDIKALNNTSKKYNQCEFLGENLQNLDVWSMSCELICNTNKYKNFCEENNYKSEKGNYKTSAEIVYRYITGIKDFDESHTSMKDCEIEKEIFFKCLKQKKAYKTGLVYNPWRKIQK